MPGYYPKLGDLVWLDFAPQAGHEQSGRRPALVVSHDAYNRKAGLILGCPVTSQRKGYPFEVSIPEGMPVSGVILADQMRSLDWRSRRALFIAKAPSETLAEAVSLIKTLTADMDD